ncbi:hypothetical protein B4O97_00470 [Marispirochaeta aestuarii]|uniref:DUF327 domain-containing protein n=1 Tax=Marispirochaeta aestuarii TaxID=1963862 RepID=A0A1Y1S403_9SPIO|nr:hypothetical protein B4O97_00470 [Marispirochaeta aestuarii]
MGRSVDRIDPLTGAPIPFHRNEKRRVEKKGEIKKDFRSFVQSADEAEVALDLPDIPDGADLEGILDEIHEAGERLSEDPGMKNVLAYKRIVKAFLRYVVKNTRQIEHQEGARLSIFKAPKRYTLISVVDKKLEQLAAGILQNQSDKLEILKKVEEIQGLLVDLTG